MNGAPTTSIFALLAMSVGLLVIAGCAAKDADAQTKIRTVLTESFGMHLPSNLTNVESAYYTYSSMDGGTRVWLQHLAGESAAATNVLQQLEEKHITVLPNYSPIEDQNASRHVPWWHPEKLGRCDTFKLSGDKGNVGLSLTGDIFSTPTNSSLSLF